MQKLRPQPGGGGDGNGNGAEGGDCAKQRRWEPVEIRAALLTSDDEGGRI